MTKTDQALLRVRVLLQEIADRRVSDALENPDLSEETREQIVLEGEVLYSASVCATPYLLANLG